MCITCIAKRLETKGFKNVPVWLCGTEPLKVIEGDPSENIKILREWDQTQKEKRRVMANSKIHDELLELAKKHKLIYDGEAGVWSDGIADFVSLYEAEYYLTTKEIKGE